MKAACKDIVVSLKSVSTDASDLFKEASQELIDEIGPMEALSRAIAYISGYTDKMK
jgi:nucleoside-triphosphatase THEP1